VARNPSLPMPYGKLRQGEKVLVMNEDVEQTETQVTVHLGAHLAGERNRDIAALGSKVRGRGGLQLSDGK
jgi:hypothetical protein